MPQQDLRDPLGGGTVPERRDRADSFRPGRAWKSGATFMKLRSAPATEVRSIFHL